MNLTRYSILRFMLTACVGIPLLQGCGPLQVRDTQAGAWVPIQAAAVEIHRDIVIPRNRTRIFFQNGAPTSGLNEFQPFCWLEVSTLLEKGQTVHPGSFTVTRTGTRMQEVVESTPIVVAALDPIALGLGSSDDTGGPSRLTRMLTFWLHSADQPDVRNLVCGGAFDDPSDAVAPTVQEIAAALGDYVTLILH